MSETTCHGCYGQITNRYPYFNKEFTGENVLVFCSPKCRGIFDTQLRIVKAKLYLQKYERRLAVLLDDKKVEEASVAALVEYSRSLQSKLGEAV